MSYATPAEFAARYTTRIPDADVGNHYLPYASSRLEALLATGFSVPFAANNLTAKDLTLELAYLMVQQRSKDPRDYQPLAQVLEKRLQALLEGREAMMTTSGQALWASTPQAGVWSTTTRYRPVFGLGEASTQQVDPWRLLDETAP